jgi:hypothetical protein
MEVGCRASALRVKKMNAFRKAEAFTKGSEK